MAINHDTMRKALAVLGYGRVDFFEGAWWELDFEQPEYMAPPRPTTELIPTDLASLLGRCRDQGIWFNVSPASKTFSRVELETGGLDTQLGVRHNWDDQTKHNYCGECDELTALIHALAGLHDAKEANRE
jgi:hypothetical protein